MTCSLGPQNRYPMTQCYWWKGKIWIRNYMLANLLYLTIRPASRKGYGSGETYRQKVKLATMALNHLQEPRVIKTRQCKHKVSHFYSNYFLHIAFRVIFEAFSYIVL